MNDRLSILLEHIERTVDLARQREIARRYQETLSWKPVERLPLAVTYPLSPDTVFPPFPTGEIYGDPEKMLYNELVQAFGASIANHSRVGDDLPFTVRANFGVVIIASLFDARIEQAANNPPWVRQAGDPPPVERLLEHDPLDFRRGWCPRVIQTYAAYRELMRPYPKAREAIRLVLPDLQGPLDTAELLRGPELYTDLYERPELVEALLDRIATAQVAFAKHLAPRLSDGPTGFCHQHAAMLAGQILIRNDSAIMISAAMYRTRIAPHDERVLREMQGGGIHSCGNFGRLVGEYLQLPSLRGIDFGQAELNDVDSVYRLAQARRIALVRVKAKPEELVNGLVHQRYPTGVVLRCDVASIQQAVEVFGAYRSACERRTAASTG